MKILPLTLAKTLLAPHGSDSKQKTFSSAATEKDMHMQHPSFKQLSSHLNVKKLDRDERTICTKCYTAPFFSYRTHQKKYLGTRNCISFNFPFSHSTLWSCAICCLSVPFQSVTIQKTVLCFSTLNKSPNHRLFSAQGKQRH